LEDEALVKCRGGNLHGSFTSHRYNLRL